MFAWVEFCFAERVYEALGLFPVVPAGRRFSLSRWNRVGGLPQTLAAPRGAGARGCLNTGVSPLLEIDRLFTELTGALVASTTRIRAPLWYVGSPHRPAVLSVGVGSLLTILSTHVC